MNFKTVQNNSRFKNLSRKFSAPMVICNRRKTAIISLSESKRLTETVIDRVSKHMLKVFINPIRLTLSGFWIVIQKPEWYLDRAQTAL